ncbi:MAG: hypothetical protein FJ144_28230 [Deltaproteobacteria bacterium]|nr:hypothetical protein [Deltaproteobacteria bacterium]
MKVSEEISAPPPSDEPRPPSIEEPRPRSTVADVFIAFALGAATLLVYGISQHFEGPSPYNFHVLLANAFVNGRIDLPQLSWLELAEWKGKFYTVFPPAPALVLTPFALVWGEATDQAYFSIAMGSLNVALCYATLRTLFKSRALAVWVSLLHAFGTIHWYHAQVGSGWYFAHIVAITFLWLALLASLHGRHFFWSGLFVGAAFLARLPTIFAALFFPIYFFSDFITLDGRRSRIHWRNGLAFSAGVLPGLLGYYLYNYLRFGTFEDVGYTLVLHPRDPSYIHGFLSLRYVPIHLREMFATMPRVLPGPPYFAPSVFAMAIWIATPALVLMFRAPLFSRLTAASVVASLAIAAPNLMHGGNGFTQFGYRHTLDFLPFLLLLIAAGMRERVGWIAASLIVASILANIWGVVTLTVLDLYSF